LNLDPTPEPRQFSTLNSDRALSIPTKLNKVTEGSSDPELLRKVKVPTMEHMTFDCLMLSNVKQLDA
jgi:hypothetical protein